MLFHYFNSNFQKILPFHQNIAILLQEVKTKLSNYTFKKIIVRNMYQNEFKVDSFIN